jgi:hypothetical protein
VEAAVRIPGPDATQLEWFLSSGVSAFYRSSFGATLARCEAASRDSAGNPIAVPVGTDKWLYIIVPPEARNAGYEVDDTALFRFARVSRRLLAVERIDPMSVRAIEVYYGDDGARWGRQDGLGRIVSLYPFTRTGTAILRREMAREALSGAHLDMMPSERLANVAAIQTRALTEKLKHELGRMATEAEALLDRAGNAWAQTTWGEE